MMFRTPSGIRLTCLVATGLSVVIGWTATEAHDGATSFTARPNEVIMRTYSNWMSRLPDAVALSQVSIPGTHDTCALRNGLSFGFAKCQTWELKDQLAAGIRFIDIRCRHIDDKLRIYHGAIDQRKTFEEVRDVCRSFLKQHPSECIVMSVKEESTAQNNSRTFAKTFADATRNDHSLWHIDPKIPQLGSVRNHIVLVDRVGNLGGLNWNELQRQDRYDAPVDLKATLIRSHFEQASLAAESQWFINFCSGTVPGSLLTPRLYALQSNATALEFLQEPTRRSPLRLGTVMMDFPGEELIQQIVESNFAHHNGN